MTRLVTTRAAVIALLIGMNAFLPAGCAFDEGGCATSPDVYIGLDHCDPWYD